MVTSEKVVTMEERLGDATEWIEDGTKGAYTASFGYGR